MTERWLRLINALTARLLEDPGLVDEIHEVVEEFVSQGHQARDVETALAWIIRFTAGPLWGAAGAEEPIASRGLRARSAEEQFSFTPEAFGYLLRLENSGLIDPSIREEILERALGTYDEEIGEEEMKTVSRLVLMDYGIDVFESLDGPPDPEWRGRSRHLN